MYMHEQEGLNKTEITCILSESAKTHVITVNYIEHFESRLPSNSLRRLSKDCYDVQDLTNRLVKSFLFIYPTRPYKYALYYGFSWVSCSEPLEFYKSMHKSDFLTLRVTTPQILLIVQAPGRRRTSLFVCLTNCKLEDQLSVKK